MANILTSRIEALDEHGLLRSHVLHVEEFVVLTGYYTKCLALDFIAFMRSIVHLCGGLLLASIVAIVTWFSLRVEQINLHKIFWLRASPVNDGEWEVGSRVTNGPPDIDNLVSSLQKLVCFSSRKMPPYSRLSCAWRLVNVYLLDGLAGRGLLVSPDGMIEDYNLLNAWELVPQKLLYLFVISFLHLLVICEGLLFRRRVVHAEARDIRTELVLLASNVLHGVLAIGILEGSATIIDFAPRLDEGLGAVNVGRWVDVLESGGRHG